IIAFFGWTELHGLWIFLIWTGIVLLGNWQVSLLRKAQEAFNRDDGWLGFRAFAGLLLVAILSLTLGLLSVGATLGDVQKLFGRTLAAPFLSAIGSGGVPINANLTLRFPVALAWVGFLGVSSWWRLRPRPFYKWRWWIKLYRWVLLAVYVMAIVASCAIVL